MRGAQVAKYAADQAADGRSFDADARAQGERPGTVARIGQVIQTIARPPGTLEALLINPQDDRGRRPERATLEFLRTIDDDDDRP